jgi:hypothetical protein
VAVLDHRGRVCFASRSAARLLGDASGAAPAWAAVRSAVVHAVASTVRAPEPLAREISVGGDRYQLVFNSLEPARPTSRRAPRSSSCARARRRRRGTGAAPRRTGGGGRPARPRTHERGDRVRAAHQPAHGAAPRRARVREARAPHARGADRARRPPLSGPPSIRPGGCARRCRPWAAPAPLPGISDGRGRESWSYSTAASTPPTSGASQ